MAIIPPYFLSTVVALGTGTEQTPHFNATGFLYRHRSNLLFLVTNRHVVEGIDSMVARFNRADALGSRVAVLQLEPTYWSVDSAGADVAVTWIKDEWLHANGLSNACFVQGANTLSREQCRSNGLGEGNGVFVLGFPMRLVGEERNYVIARQGIVARIQDWLEDKASHFLIDASVFPGNSGGPVITKPEPIQFTGTTTMMSCCLIGMVSSYLTYQDVATSQQTGEARITFVENSGLASVVPIDVIQATVESAVNRINA